MLVRAVDGVVLAKVDAPGNLTEQGIQLIVRVEDFCIEKGKRITLGNLRIMIREGKI